jgi:hypothetical protein
MSIGGRWAPHPPAPVLCRVASLALLVPCGFCWAEPGMTCTDAGQHYARYLRIYRRGILDATGLAAVSKAIAYITVGTIVPDSSMPRSTARLSPGPYHGSEASCHLLSPLRRGSATRLRKRWRTPSATATRPYTATPVTGFRTRSASSARQCLHAPAHTLILAASWASKCPCDQDRPTVTQPQVSTGVPALIEFRCSQRRAKSSA